MLRLVLEVRSTFGRRVVSNDQTNFSKTCSFGKKTLATLSQKMAKLSKAKHCTFGKFLEILGNFLIITPSYFIQTSHSSRREPTARRRSLWSKCWRGKDSRHSPCTSEVGSPSSLAKFAWEKLRRLLFVMMLQHPLKTTPMWHPRGPHGQCRQPYHSCYQ